MKRLMTKIWVPTLLVLVAAVQSFGIDTARAISYRKHLDSLEFNRLDDSIAATPVAVDSFNIIAPDSLVTDTTAVDTLILSEFRFAIPSFRPATHWKFRNLTPYI